MSCLVCQLSQGGVPVGVNPMSRTMNSERPVQFISRTQVSGRQRIDVPCQSMQLGRRWADWHLPQRAREACFRRGQLGQGLSVTFSDSAWIEEDYQAELNHHVPVTLLVFGQEGISSFSLAGEEQSCLVRPGDVWVFSLDETTRLVRKTPAAQRCRMAVIRCENQRLEDNGVAFRASVSFRRLARGVDPEHWLAPLYDNPLASVADRLLAESQALALLGQWLSEPTHNLAACHDCPPAVRRVVDYCMVDLGRSPSMTELAALAGVSHPQLTRLFRRHMGWSVFTWLRLARLNQAAEWLRHTDRSVTDIALDLGFSHGSHLARHFKNEFGCTPARFRAGDRSHYA